MVVLLLFIVCLPDVMIADVLRVLMKLTAAVEMFGVD